MYGDLTFLSRFTGNPAGVPDLGKDLCGTFEHLRSERAALDQRILDWSKTLTPNWLAGSLTYTSKIDGKTRTVPRWVRVTHMFNHETQPWPGDHAAYPDGTGHGQHRHCVHVAIPYGCGALIGSNYWQ